MLLDTRPGERLLPFMLVALLFASLTAPALARLAIPSSGSG